MRANECKYCVFCRKVKNRETCVAFISFPNLLVVNLARNVDTIKCKNKVSLSRYVQIKGKDCSDLDAMSELISVVVHLGDKVEGGHFICYIFLSGYDIIEINDQSVCKLDLSKVKTDLEKNSYLFFYKKQTDNNSSDSTFEEHNYCKKRKKVFVKRLKITAVESSFDTQLTIKRRYSILIIRGGQYRVQKYRGTFFIKYRGTPSNFRVIESFFLQALRHVFVFPIDCNFKVVS